MAHVDITVNNQLTTLNGDVDENLISSLSDSLSYRMEGVEFTPGYLEDQDWDGRKTLLCQTRRGEILTGCYFYTGVLGRIRKALEGLGVAYSIRDERNLPKRVLCSITTPGIFSLIV